jgi:hypothetical protein
MSCPPLLLPLLALVLALPTPRAQDSQDTKAIACRVTSSGPGQAILIDRGSRDGVEKGDTVVLRPRQGGVLNARVSSVSSRSSAITLIGAQTPPPAGTGGEVQIPKSRVAVKPEKTAEPKAGETKIPGPQVTEKPTTKDAEPSWRNKDRDYRTGMPLLTGMRPRQPTDRKTRTTGSIYMIADLTLDQAGSDNSLFRMGTNLTVENFLQHGDLHFDGEINYATAFDDTLELDLLVRNLSYVMGGNRFSKHRLEFGRFLQHANPELQFLDGVEWGYRMDNGSRVGASLGFMPEPDADFESLTDSQFSLYYEWVNGLAEVLSLSAAYQKSFNKGTADRDLILAKMRYSPYDAWNVNGTVWIDIYDGRDQTRNSPVELTEAWLGFHRLWEDGSGMDLTYRHSAFPEIVRKEFLPPFPPNEIADSHYDRLTWRTWKVYADDSRLHGRVMGFLDQDGAGWSVEGGHEWPNWFQSASRTDISFYGGAAPTVNSVGARINYNVPSAAGAWNWFYDISFRHNLDIADDRDDFMQHRLRGSHDFRIFGDWETYLYSEARLWDLEFSWSIGFFLQKSF